MTAGDGSRLVPTFCNRRSGDGSAMGRRSAGDGAATGWRKAGDSAAKGRRGEGCASGERQRSRESGLEESTVKLFLKRSVRC